VARNTIRRWNSTPAFQEEVARQREALFRRAADRLAGLQGLAIRTLAGLLKNPATQETVKLGAARCVLEHSIKAREALDVTRRLAEIEAQLPQGRG
jgi:hypothetical protein